ncbi:DUF3892 domain-containing protein [Chryseobacterium sp. FH1]|uniref:DUF3892 domain-containing protein n=1 Tax=Chryseobacterium sp. FH1 TaxID=1233951 RepID=UPI0004E37752|nr:DUF3892 domain-containing protein [Chryseobacterium sp. FH1]KFC20076.1 hypothetical protein IO90_12805 [Chryseobacterium sp. FH1]
MAHYAISGVWKDANGTITDYAIHTANKEKNTVDNPAKKYSKAEAIKLLDNSQNSAQTLLWNYTSKVWKWGTDIIVVATGTNKYLRTIQDGTVQDNLDHLINYTFVTNNMS